MIKTISFKFFKILSQIFIWVISLGLLISGCVNLTSSKKKSGIILMLAGFILIPIFYKRLSEFYNKYFNKKLSKLLLYSLAFGLFGVSLLLSPLSSQSLVEQSKEQLKITDSEKINNQNKSEPGSTLSEAVTIDNITEKVNSSFTKDKEAIKDVTMAYDTIVFNINVDKLNSFDTKHSYEQLLGYIPKVGKESFKLEKINKIFMSAYGTVTDSYGKKNFKNVFSIGVKKELYSKFEWENIKCTNLHKKLTDEGADFDTNITIENLDKSKVCIYKE